MGTVTAYNLQNVQDALGGTHPIGMNEYYRGGAFVPTTRTVTVREPSSGEFFQYNNPGYNMQVGYGSTYLVWNSATNTAVVSGNQTSITTGGFTYFRGSYRMSAGPYGEVSIYAVFRTSSSTQTINTGVPSSGSISISQLFGASNP